MVRKREPPPLMDRNRSHQLRITLKFESSEPEVTGRSVSGANLLLLSVESSRTMTFQGWYLVQGHPSREVFRVQSHGASEDSDFHQVTKP